MIWPDSKIKNWALKGGITPYDGTCVNPASIDLKLGGTYRVPAENHTWSLPIEFETLTLEPGKFILCHSAEYTIIPKSAIATLYLKSSAGRKGLEHLHAGYGDPGFAGQWTFELHSLWPEPIVLHAGGKYLQLVFQEILGGGVERDYTQTGHYCNQTGPTPHWESKPTL